MNSKSREAKHGEKMIEVKVRFWTNDIATGKNRIKPKHAWSSGIIRLESKKAHGIKGGKTFPFHSLMDITAVMEEALIQQGIKLHPSRKMKKYFD